MATLVLEDGTGVSTANSYMSASDADSYFDDHSSPAAWTALSTSDKEQALIEAAQYLDTFQWAGQRVKKAQNLSWPRLYMNLDGFGINSNEIPQRLKDAQAILALKFTNDGDLLVDESASARAVKRKSIKVGEINTAKEFQVTSSAQKKYHLAMALIQPFLVSGNTILRA